MDGKLDHSFAKYKNYIFQPFSILKKEKKKKIFRLLVKSKVKSTLDLCYPKLRNFSLIATILRCVINYR